NFAENQRRFQVLERGAKQMLNVRARDGAAFVMEMGNVKAAVEGAGADGPDLRRALKFRMAMQADIGIPNDRVRLLTRAEAGALAAEVQSAAVEDRAAKVAGLQDLYGPLFGRAMKELSEEGLDPRFRVLAAARRNPALARTLAEAIEAGGAEMEKDAAKTREIRDDVRDAAADAASTAEPGGETAEAIEAIRSAAEDLGVQFFRQTGRKDESVRRAAAFANGAIEEVRLSAGEEITDAGEDDQPAGGGGDDTLIGGDDTPTGDGHDGSEDGDDTVSGNEPDPAAGDDDETTGRNAILEGAGFTFVKGQGKGKGAGRWVDKNGAPAQPGKLREIVTETLGKRAEEEGWSASRILTELHKARNGLPFDDRKNIEVAGWFLPFVAAAGEGGAATVGAALAEGLGAFLAALGLAGVLSLSGDTPREEADTEDDERETVTVYRVEGVKNARILVRENGTVLIVGNDKKVLFLNFGQRKRAEEFLQQRLLTGFKDSVLKSFNVEREFLDDVRRQAIPSDERRESPAKMQKPIRVDETKAPDQFGLTEGDIQELRRFIVQGTGRVETPADLNIEVGR
ncbi:MAG: hypothetical protein ACE5FR_14005, partial [Rhodospirillales bacterium]